MRNRQCERVHDPDKRNDTAGLAVQTDRLTNAAHAAPIGADAAALGSEPDIFVPRVHNAIEAVGHGIEVAADGQAARGAAVRKNRRCGHEPQIGDVFVNALCVLFIIGIGIGDAGKQILIAFARQEIAIFQRFLAEFGQIGIARVICLHIKTARQNGLGIAVRLRCSARGFSQRSRSHAGSFRSEQIFRGRVVLVH